MSASWQQPSGLLPRGTLVVLPGRGEHSGVYERFGRRLANDAYVVHSLDTGPYDDAAALAAAVRAVAADAPAPLVLVGSDTGALQVLALLASGAVPAAGAVLAGLPTVPTGGTPGPSDWDGELSARTACPTHQARLTGDAAFTRGSLSTPVPAALAAVLGAPAALREVPVLLLHGTADVIAPPADARAAAARLPRAELALVEGGRHDVLNDIMHRSVAAQVVLWLERLRGGGDLAPIIRVEAPSAAVV